MNSSERIDRIAAFVRERLKEAAAAQPEHSLNSDYRWRHTLRVSNYGKLIAEAEGAQVALVVAACLLHDVAVFDPGDRREHGRLGAQISQSFLLDLGYSPEETENICYSVASHVDVHNLETLEAKIVSDADNIDRFGAYQILMWCRQGMDDYESWIVGLQERLKTLEGYRKQDLMETSTGQVLFNEQLDRQIAFFKALIGEKILTALPGTA